MVGSGYVVKLGDFGMTRAMYDSDYYRFGRKGKSSLVVKSGCFAFLSTFDGHQLGPLLFLSLEPMRCMRCIVSKTFVRPSCLSEIIWGPCP